MALLDGAVANKRVAQQPMADTVSRPAISSSPREQRVCDDHGADRNGNNGMYQNVRTFKVCCPIQGPPVDEKGIDEYADGYYGGLSCCKPMEHLGDDADLGWQRHAAHKYTHRSGFVTMEYVLASAAQHAVAAVDTAPFPLR